MGFHSDSTHLILSKRADTIKKESLIQSKKEYFGRFSMALPRVAYEFTEHTEGQK